MTSLPCPFCEIADGSMPATDRVERPMAVSFEPLAPATEGHRLVVPTIHVCRLPQLHEASALHFAHLMDAVTAEYKRARRVDGVEGMNVVIQDGEAGGQSVEHLHVHVVPRRVGDGLGYRWEPAA